MKNMLLVRHPAPFPSESPYGYILRLSEVNGYSTPRAIFRLAGMSEYKRIRIGQLANLVNRSAAQLEAIANKPHPDFALIARLRRNRARVVDLRPRICPLCIREKGVIEAHWDLVFMTACPVHCGRALSKCESCQKPLNWFRRGLLECRCGATLATAGSLSNSAECNLLDVVRRKILGLDISAGHALGPPALPLYSMNLRSLIVVVLALGKNRLRADGCKDIYDSEEVVRAAAKVLTDWPTNFVELLRAIGERQLTVQGTEFDWIYKALFPNPGIAPAAEFFKEAFVEFANSPCGQRLFNKRMLERFGIVPSGRFLTNEDVARRLGVESHTATRILTLHNVPSKPVRYGRHGRRLFDMSGVTIPPIPRPHPGKIFRVRQAARFIGIPTNWLRQVRRSGHYVSTQVPGNNGYYELDIEEFRQRLLDLSPKVPDPLALVDCVNLGRIGERGSHCVAGLLAALLSGELPVVGNIDGTVKGLLIRRSDYDPFLRESRAKIYGNARTVAEVATELDCDVHTVPGLVSRALLRGTRLPSGLHVFEDSVAEFKQRYVSLLSIAKKFHTTPTWLRRDCKQLGISVIRVPISPTGVRQRIRQPFVCIEDGQRLIRFRKRKQEADLQAA
jgi:hypothetical protein